MKNLAACLLAGLLAGCATGPRLDTTYNALFHDSRAQFLVIHYTHQDFPTALRTLTEEKVSSHYLVRDDPPIVYRLVDESRSAWHAGLSSWRGYTFLNASSIGIEIVYRGVEDALDPAAWNEYPKAQMDVVVGLVKDIVARHRIPPEHVVGHSDIAPQRKKDPGPRFPWKRLADEGLVVWPNADEVSRRLGGFEARLPDVLWFQDRLAKHGFEVSRHGDLDAPTRKVIAAFQMKHRPAKFDGEPDAETAAILDVLVRP